MKIAGFRKTSLIDYPDHISAIIFTQGCNFRCPYCHNPELIPFSSEKDFMDIDYFWQFLEDREHLLDGIVITGGEPTLQDDIIDFIENIKNRGLKVKLDTNGTQFNVIDKLLSSNLVDYLAMDLKSSREQHEKITGSTAGFDDIISTLNLMMNTEIEYEFRTTVVPGMHDEQEIEKIAELIENADTYYIQNFRNNVTYNPELQETTPFPESKLEEFKNIAGKYVRNVEVRN